MPVSENVSLEMVLMFKRFLQQSYEDFVTYKSRATLRGFIISLYETAKVVFTYNLDEKKGKPNYKYVKQGMPDTEFIFSLENIRDNLTHNYHRINDVVLDVEDSLTQFGKNKIIIILHECGLDESAYDEVMKFCTSYRTRQAGNVSWQSGLGGFMGEVVDGINKNNRR